MTQDHEDACLKESEVVRPVAETEHTSLHAAISCDAVSKEARYWMIMSGGVVVFISLPPLPSTFSPVRMSFILYG